MLINHVTFDIGPDLHGFEKWYLPLAAQIASHEGCLTYQYLRDPVGPRRGVVVEVWASAEAHAAHATNPVLIEILALGSELWGLRDLVVRQWRSAEDYREAQSPRTDVARGDDEVDGLVAAFQRQYLAETRA
jgi:quinol monooxygenase YgiN